MPIIRNSLLAAGLLMTLAAAALAGIPAAPRPAPEPRVVEARAAIEKGDVETLRRLLDAGVSAKAVDGDGAPLILTAACYGKADVMQLLLDRGADPNVVLTPSPPGEPPVTPVSRAATGGYPDVVRLLAKAGATLDAPAAVAAGDVARLRQLAKQDPDLLLRMWDFEPRSAEQTLIQLAAWYDSPAVIAALVDLGADARASDGTAFTPLLWAASEGRLEAVTELLKYDDRVNYAGQRGLTPLNFAALNRHEDMVKRLLEVPGAAYDIFTAAARGDLARVQELVKADPALVGKKVADDTPLVWAARNNQRAVVQFLLDAGSDINSHDEYFGAPLTYAAEEGHVEIVKLLLDRGADTEVGAGHFPYGTALHWAARKGNVDLLALLLDRGAAVDSVNNSHDTPLEFAAGQGQMAAARLLLDRGAKIDGAGSSPLAAAVSEDRTDMVRFLLERGASASALQTAVHHGNPDMVELLLKQKVDPKAVDPEGKTALALAIEWMRPPDQVKYRRIVDLLLAHGFGLEDPGRLGYTALHTVIRGGRGDVSDVAFILDHGADIKARTADGDTVLHLACMRRDPDRVKLLLDRGAEVNVANKDGRMPIYFALPADDDRAKAVVAMLLEHKAELDVFAEAQLGLTDKVLARLDADPKLVAATDGHQTLLHLAASRGDLRLIRALVEKGADLEAPGWWKETPLHLAVFDGHTDVVKYLIGRGARVEAPAAYNQGILYSAAMDGHADIVRLLLAAGADARATNDYGHAPLRAAVESGSAETVKVLLDAGLDVNGVAKDGGTVLDEAVQGGHEDVVRLLIERGARLDGKTGDTYSPPLHTAATGKSVAILRMLLKAGEPVNRLNEREETALDWALSNGNYEAAKVLREAGGMQAHEIASPDRVASLVKRLGDPDYQVRETAQKALRGIAPRAADLLREAAQKTDDPEVRTRLRQILESIPPGEKKP